MAEPTEGGVTPREATLHRTALLESALHYARRGWSVFPLHSVIDGRCSCGRECERNAGKHPRTEHGLLDATTDLERIRSWWAAWPDANLGIPTGAATFFVLDVDPEKGGAESLAALVAQHGPLPATVEACTGGGGRHLCFQHPGGHLPNSASLLGPGLDTRGDGGYIVAAPSRHRSGRWYEWELAAHPDDVSLAPVPAWLLTRLQQTSANGSGPATPVDEIIPEGGRNATLTSLAGSMRRRGMTAEEILAALEAVNARRCVPPLALDELRQIAQSVGRYAPADDHADAEPGFPLYDGSEPWEFPAVAELIEALLPASGIVWWGGLPKRYKSLFALYCALGIACRRSQVAQKFLVRTFPKILYVAREDGGARLQARREDILRAWTERPEPGAIVFCIRPRLDLLNPEHIAWLRDTCLKLGTTMLVLDTWTALSPGADPLGAKDQAQLAAIVVQLCEDIGGLVIVVDHSRKNRPDGQPLSSADIFGPPQKWAAAEHIVMLDVVDAGRRLEVFIEGKDLETRRFFLAVSPQGSGEEKFTYAGSVEELGDAQRQIGDRNRQAVLDTLAAAGQPISVGELVDLLKGVGLTLKPDTVAKHLGAHVQAGTATKSGSGRWTRYSRTGPSSGYDEPSA